MEFDKVLNSAALINTRRRANEKKATQCVALHKKPSGQIRKRQRVGGCNRILVALRVKKQRDLTLLRWSLRFEGLLINETIAGQTGLAGPRGHVAQTANVVIDQFIGMNHKLA